MSSGVVSGSPLRACGYKAYWQDSCRAYKQVPGSCKIHQPIQMNCANPTSIFRSRMSCPQADCLFLPSSFWTNCACKRSADKHKVYRAKQLHGAFATGAYLQNESRCVNDGQIGAVEQTCVSPEHQANHVLILRSQGNLSMTFHTQLVCSKLCAEE